MIALADIPSHQMLQARQNKLMADYTASLPAADVVKADVAEAMAAHRSKLQGAFLRTDCTLTGH